MPKDDLTLVRIVEFSDTGPDVVAVKRMMSRAGVGYPRQVKQQGRFNNRFGPKLLAAVKRFQKKNGLADDGDVGYMTFKPLVKFADAYDSHLLRKAAKQQVGDWGSSGASPPGPGWTWASISSAPGRSRCSPMARSCG